MNWAEGVGLLEITDPPAVGVLFVVVVLALAGEAKAELLLCDTLFEFDNTVDV